MSRVSYPLKKPIRWKNFKNNQKYKKINLTESLKFCDIEWILEGVEILKRKNC